MPTRLGIWRTNLFAALGVATVACGGESTRHDVGAGGTAGSGGAAGSGGGTPPCENEQPVLDLDGNDTGFATCEGGFMHRRERRDCPSMVPRPGPIAAGGGCAQDSDCASLPNGYCGPDVHDIWATVKCVSGCVRDEDCEGGRIRICGNPIGNCTSTLDCQTDDDCGGALCTSTRWAPVCREWSVGVFACQRPSDQCQSIADCNGGANCEPGPEGRTCQMTGFFAMHCGARPFLVSGRARVATVSEVPNGWALTATPSFVGLDVEQRAALSEHWTKLGLLEHASVAAFARFALHLLSLGAPASLVRETERALGDEIAHTRLCFGLASAYAGRTLEPGSLVTHDALGELSFLDIVATAIAEACVGETLAAAELAEALEHARDPEVRRALERISEDEARHAELGWKFLRWALERATPGMRRRLVAHAETLVRAELQTSAPATHAGFGAELVVFGVLSPALRYAARQAALREVLVPLVDALRSSRTVSVEACRTVRSQPVS